MSASARGWGPPGCNASQLVRITLPGLVDHPPYFPVRVRREVAPLFRELLRWLVAERAKRNLPTTSSGGYHKRLIPGTDRWSNHSWGLAVDVNAATNPYRVNAPTDMPPGTSAKARSLGMVWGGDYRGKRDPMHFEFVGTPAEAARLARALAAPASRTREDDMTADQAAQLRQTAADVGHLKSEMDALRRDIRELGEALNLKVRDRSKLDGEIES